jgi:hypothetical protein
VDRIWSEPSLPLFHRFRRKSHATSTRSSSFLSSMKVEQESLAVSEVNSMDRRPIQLDLPPAQAGIMAALRRAFEAAASEPSDRDFADLLRQLN